MAKFLLLLLLLGASLVAQAVEEVPVCYNYDCAVIEVVEFDAEQMNAIRLLLAAADNAAAEREAISRAIGLFETYTGQQTPTWADKGGNIADDGVEGRMDCHDESSNTSTYLHLLERNGWLKFHRVLEPAFRVLYLVSLHWAAHIVEKNNGREFAVDSWFFDNGHPAVVLPLEDWKNGAGPE